MLVNNLELNVLNIIDLTIKYNITCIGMHTMHLYDTCNVKYEIFILYIICYRHKSQPRSHDQF